MELLIELGTGEMPADSYQRLADIIDGKSGQLEQMVKDFGRTDADYESFETSDVADKLPISLNPTEISDACSLLEIVLEGGNPFEEEETVASSDFSILASIFDDDDDVEVEEPQPLETYEPAAEQMPQEKPLQEPVSEPESASEGSVVPVSLSAFDKRNMNAHWLSDKEDGKTGWESYQQSREFLAGAIVDSEAEEYDPFAEASAVPIPVEDEEEFDDFEDLDVDGEPIDEVPAAQAVEDEEEFDDFEDLEFDIDEEIETEVAIDTEEDGIVEESLEQAEEPEASEYDEPDDDDDLFSTYVESDEEDTGLDDGAEDPADGTYYYEEMEEDGIKTMNYAAGTLGPLDDDDEFEDVV